MGGRRRFLWSGLPGRQFSPRRGKIFLATNALLLASTVFFYLNARRAKPVYDITETDGGMECFPMRRIFHIEGSRPGLRTCPPPHIENRTHGVGRPPAYSVWGTELNALARLFP